MRFTYQIGRSGLTTTTSGSVGYQGAGVDRQKEGMSEEVSVGTLNVLTMTGKEGELADIMERRKVYTVACKSILSP